MYALVWASIMPMNLKGVRDGTHDYCSVAVNVNEMLTEAAPGLLTFPDVPPFIDLQSITILAPFFL